MGEFKYDLYFCTVSNRYNDTTKKEMNVDDSYESILVADEFIKNFDTMEAFRDWCDTGSLEDLDEVRRVFEAYELYEHCAVIKDIMLKKDD